MKDVKDVNLDEYPILKQLEELCDEVQNEIDIMDLTDEMFMTIVKAENFESFIEQCNIDGDDEYMLYIRVTDLNDLCYFMTYAYRITEDLYKDFKNNRVREIIV